MSQIPERTRRTVYGLLATLGALVLLELLPVPFVSQYRLFGYFWVWPAVPSLVSMVIASFAGAYVAKIDFVGPSLLLAFVVWALGINLLHTIAAAAGQGDIVEIAASNLLGLTFSMIGAVIGAIFARRFFPQGAGIASNAA